MAAHFTLLHMCCVRLAGFGATGQGLIGMPLSVHSTLHPHDPIKRICFCSCRVLAKHLALEETWASQAVTLAAKYGKQPADTALARAFNFRKRREKLDHIHKSKPVHERIGSDVFWQISLREAYSRCASPQLQCIFPPAAKAADASAADA